MKATVEEAILDINSGDYVPCMPAESEDPDRKCTFCGMPIPGNATYYEPWGTPCTEDRREGFKEWKACNTCFELNTFFRADGDCVCNACGLPYSTHPEVLSFKKLCSGQLVKT